MVLEIESLDPFGQGVAKKDGQVYFIPKVLPGESVEIEIVSKRKGVIFARATKIIKRSTARIESECEHFESCNSCHYLHTDYENELNFKKINFLYKLKNGLKQNLEHLINIIPANNRFHYRNRIQLHYENQNIGYRNGNQITPVPNCKLPIESVSIELKQIYDDSKNSIYSKKGHVEIYHKDLSSKPLLSHNKSYAHSGFTQVNQVMNDKISQIVTDEIDKSEYKQIIDLFGGGGNLTQKIKNKEVLVVDSNTHNSPNNEFQKFHTLNLYDKKSLYQLKNILPKEFKPEILVLDPPRTGLKNLDQFTQELKPNLIIYVSCNPDTLVRDTSKIINSYKVQSVFLIDMFPSTYHYESIMILQRLD